MVGESEPGRAILLLTHVLKTPEIEADYHAWYDEEHIPERLALPGVLSAQRYEVVRGEPRFLILYELEDLTTLDEKRNFRLPHNSSPWTMRMIRHFDQPKRNLYRLRDYQAKISPRAQAGQGLVVEMSDSDADREQNFVQWRSDIWHPDKIAHADVTLRRTYEAVVGAPPHLDLWTLSSAPDLSAIDSVFPEPTVNRQFPNAANSTQSTSNIYSLIRDYR